MGASKRYKGKDCAYCGSVGSSSTNDHVIARLFFLDSERDQTLSLPQVPSCNSCNNIKSELELYVGSTLLIGSKHPEANRYRREKIKPRLERNQKIRNELNLDAPPKWVDIDGIIQPLHMIAVDASKITTLLELIVRGLYHHHYGKPLPKIMYPHVQMVRPDQEASMWARVSEYFPPDAKRFSINLGRGSFVYSGVQSPALEGFTAWVIGLHGQIRLYGEDGSADHWWCMTRPTKEAVHANAS